MVRPLCRQDVWEGPGVQNEQLHWLRPAGGNTLQSGCSMFPYNNVYKFHNDDLNTLSTNQPELTATLHKLSGNLTLPQCIFLATARSIPTWCWQQQGSFELMIWLGPILPSIHIRQSICPLACCASLTFPWDISPIIFCWRISQRDPRVKTPLTFSYTVVCDFSSWG